MTGMKSGVVTGMKSRVGCRKREEFVSESREAATKRKNNKVRSRYA